VGEIETRVRRRLGYESDGRLPPRAGALMVSSGAVLVAAAAGEGRRRELGFIWGLAASAGGARVYREN
jgi:hypothetical protein